MADDGAGGYLNKGGVEVFCQIVIHRRTVWMPDVVPEIAVVVFFGARLSYIESKLVH